MSALTVEELIAAQRSFADRPDVVMSDEKLAELLVEAIQHS